MDSLLDFIRGPQRLQEGIRFLSHVPWPRVHVMATTDRGLSVLSGPDRRQPASAAPYLTGGGHPEHDPTGSPEVRPGAYDYVFELWTPGDARWANSLIVSEWTSEGAWDSMPGRPRMAFPELTEHPFRPPLGQSRPGSWCSATRTAGGFKSPMRGEGFEPTNSYETRP